MIADSKYSIGDRVIVFKNSERVPFMSLIGESGTVCGNRSKDALIEFDSGKNLYIYENDLMLVSEIKD